MGFGLVTSLAVSTVVAMAFGALMLRPARGETAPPFLRWSGAAWLCLGAGFALLLVAPGENDAPLRLLGNTAPLLSYGLFWGAARRLYGRPAPFEAVAAGALAWLLAASVFDLSPGWCIRITALITGGFGFAIAWEHHRGGPAAPGEDRQARHRVAWVFAAQGAFFTLRALVGPGLAASSSEAVPIWGALPVVVTAAAAALAGVLALAMSRARSPTVHPGEMLDDHLTGIGNRRALFRSGSASIAEAREAGRPATLLLMDLDRIAAVNDRHGVAVGDRLLVAFARLAHDYLPPTSLVCRIGGAAFAAVLPGADPVRARVVADEIRALFAHLAIEGPQGPVRTTVSIGIAVAAVEEGEGGGSEGDMVALLGRAQLRLNAAKQRGRNRVVGEGDETPVDGPADPTRHRPAA